MKYLSLFSGIGGFELGIQKAYDNRTNQKQETDKEALPRYGGSTVSKYSTRWGESASCVGYSEIDKYAIQIYEKHFPRHKNIGDVTKVAPSTLPDFELLVGGFPCQAFSVAGRRKGFDDTRGTLFFDVARIIKEKQPQTVLLENVKGLLSHKRGDTFRTILRVFDELGYDVEWQVLNSKDFGVPQNRERVYIIGYLRGEPRQKVFPITKQCRENKERDVTVGETVAYCLDSNYFKGTNTILKSRRQLVQSAKECAFRRLTPKECERLQAFLDDWTVDLSDTQRYKTLGNAVTTNVVQCIMERLLNT